MKNKESNVNKWNFFGWNNMAKFIKNVPSMVIGAKFLEDCETVEDWGTGDGIFKNHREDAIGVDGSNTPGADKKFIDLTTYTTQCEGIFLRHVLEHNYEWDKILHNLLKSATKKICIIMFIPFIDGETKELNYHQLGVPDLAISQQEFMKILTEYPIDFEIDKETLKKYNEEIIFITKK